MENKGIIILIVLLGGNRMHKHIFLIIRYSLLTDVSSFRQGRKHDFEDYKKVLFDPERLTKRENLFKKVTLPSLVSMNPSSDKVTLLLFTSEELPTGNKEELQRMLDPYQWAKIISLPNTANFSKSLREVLEKEMERFEKSTCYSTVRLDDDDALSPYFLELLEPYVDPMYSGFCVSFPDGFAGIYDGETQKYESFHSHYESKVAIGLAYINIYNPATRTFQSEVSNIYSIGNHKKIDRKRPVILDAKKPSFIRTIHSGSDSNTMWLTKKIKSTPEANPDEVRKIFSLHDI